jgi:hypothetical protein
MAGFMLKSKEESPSVDMAGFMLKSKEEHEMHGLYVTIKPNRGGLPKPLREEEKPTYEKG